MTSKGWWRDSIYLTFLNMSTMKTNRRTSRYQTFGMFMSLCDHDHDKLSSIIYFARTCPSPEMSICQHTLAYVSIRQHTPALSTSICFASTCQFPDIIQCHPKDYHLYSLIPLDMCPHTITCVLILLYTCPHTTPYADKLRTHMPHLPKQQLKASYTNSVRRLSSSIYLAHTHLPKSC
jgi:hypothetical protein